MILDDPQARILAHHAATATLSHEERAAFMAGARALEAIARRRLDDTREVAEPKVPR